MHPAKKGLRVCGIAESFRGREISLLAGIVMRRDLVIDGAGFGTVTVGSMDATDAVCSLIEGLDRRDIAVIMLSGTVIAWFNIIDGADVYARTGFPVIGITYEESTGLEEDIRYHFPGDEERLGAYRRLGVRQPVDLHTGYRLFMRCWGIGEDVAAEICNRFTLEGRHPEPLRVARIVARSAYGLCGDALPE